MSVELSPRSRDILVKIYIGQNVRKEGILQSDVSDGEEVEMLLSKKLIVKGHWHLDQFLTTAQGDAIASKIVNEKIEAEKKNLFERLKIIPSRALGFFVKRYVAENLAFSTSKEPFDMNARYFGSWTDAILVNSRIWMIRTDFLESLTSMGLCVKTLYYVSTEGGKPRESRYVISRDIQDFVVRAFDKTDFTAEEEKTFKLYPFLIAAKRVIAINDMDQVRQQYYELFRRSEVAEDQVADIVEEMNRQKITSEYRGFFSEWKPFDILNPTLYELYLSRNIIEPGADLLLGGKGKIKEYHVKERMPTLDEVKSELGILDDDQLGDFYVMVSSFERQLRDFIKEALGDSWEARIENDAPKVHESWLEKKGKDMKWGIEPEKELINYSDLGDYISIVKQYPRIFAEGEDLGDIIAHLKIWYNQGRNPIMHSRTVNRQKLYTTKSAIDFLSGWMVRKRVSIQPIKS